jgi:hypothetical protein
MIIVTLLSFYSCDLTEPERFYNDEPEKPQHGSIDFFDLDDTKHYAGHLTIKFGLSDLSFSVAALKVYADDRLIASFNGSENNVEFDIYTPAYSDGLHNLNIYVIPEDMGYFTLLNVPSLEFSKQIYFDQSTPEPVYLTGFEWDGNHPRLHWNISNSLNIKYYIIEKSTVGYFERIDTIFDHTVNTYLDTLQIKAVGENLGEYRITSSNGGQTSNSNTVTIKYGDRISLHLFQDFYNNLCMNIESRNQLVNLATDSSQLNIIEYKNGPIIHTISGNNFGTLSQNYDSDNILLICNTPTDKLKILDLNKYTLTTLPQFENKLNSSASLIKLKHNRIFVLGSEFQLYDYDSGELLDSKTRTDHGYPGEFCLVPDSTIFFVSSNSYTYKISCEGDSINLLNTIFTPNFGIRNQKYISSLNKIAGVIPPTNIGFYDPETFELTSSYAEKENFYPSHFLFRDNFLYVGYTLTYQTNKMEGIVIKYDVADMNKLEKWYFKKPIRRLFFPEEANKLIVFCSDESAWLIDLTEGK